MKYFSFLIATIISFSVAGQDHFLHKKGIYYLYKGQVYKCRQLDEVYKDYDVALELYNSALSHKRTANIVAITGAPFVVAGFIGLATDDLAARILGAFSIVGGGLIELIALVPRARGSRKLRKARKLFNFEMIERHGYNTDTSLSIGATGNGVGLVFQF